MDFSDAEKEMTLRHSTRSDGSLMHDPETSVDVAGAGT